jgi:hypothetical protein
MEAKGGFPHPALARGKKYRLAHSAPSIVYHITAKKEILFYQFFYSFSLKMRGCLLFLFTRKEKEAKRKAAKAIKTEVQNPKLQALAYAL